MTTASSQFEGLLDRYFEAELAENPPYAALAGLKSGEGMLGHATLALEQKREARRVSLLRALDAISPRELSNEQQLDRLALRSRLLRELVRDRPLAKAGAFAVGAETLQRRVRDQLGLDYTLGQIEALALGEVRRVGARLAEACAKFGRRRSAEAVLAEARASWRPAKPLVELYRDETRRIAAGFRAARAVTFPENESLEVRPVPDFMRAVFPTAAYKEPGAFARRQRGVFWVNDLSLTKSTESEKRAEQQQHF